MLKEILWLLAGYLAIIGLVRVVAVLVDLIAPPKAPQGCRLYLRVPEDADYTESSLIGCCRGLPCTVLLPLEPEAREICRQYCRDRNIDTLDLPQAEKWCMIKEND